MNDNARSSVCAVRRATAGVAVAAALCGLAACSHKEEHQASVKPAVRTAAIATPAANSLPSAVPRNTEPTVARPIGTTLPRDAQSFGTPQKPAAITPERRAAFLSAEHEFAQKAIAAAVARKAQECTAADGELVKAEVAVRASDPAVRAAYEAWDQARAAYQSVCEAAIAGHADLTRQVAELRASVDQNLAASENGAVANANAVSLLMKRLDEVTRSLGDLERRAIYERPQAEVRQAHEAMNAAYGAYRKALSADPVYGTAVEKRATILSEQTKLVTRQGELSSEN